MDLALFFVLPLIGGFAFATSFDLLRYRTGREDSQRLYYRAALIGVLLAMAGLGLHWLLARHPTYASWTRSVTSAVVSPLLEKERSSGTVELSALAKELKVQAVTACLFGFLLGVATPIWNRAIRAMDWLWIHLPIVPRRTSFLDRLNLNSITDQMERLITQSLLEKTLLQVTLSNSKVYVGSVHESLNPASPAKYFKIQPWMSGQRRAADGRVDFNTYYDQVLAALESSDPLGEIASTFQLVIPMDKVVSASGFSLPAYLQFEVARMDQDDVDMDKDKAEPAMTSWTFLMAAAAMLVSWLSGRRT